ncbi:general transcription factor IIH subunit 5-like protein [Anaeromyces robustus]|uniref:General transcription and DNA repair factor IIH subunit TFB5 n=1 Tax=Anaeromyces robustus TaxID=1754192 RepID=A0A1Y1WTV6_9FUNG|nr:general transcription factor IIH subunit 5-like protein [Anaeromyces robustus]|eukprot:ORX76967.1 general transcription factor IIH subunit 5-like protein [Anaeromyces robustus]
MVKAQKGALIEVSDPTVKSVLLELDEEHHFIIKDLDDTHVFVNSIAVEMIREKLDKIMEDNTYKILEE